MSESAGNHRWRGQRVLVTGSSGFIGANLIQALAAVGCAAVWGVDMRRPRIEVDATHHEVDVEDLSGLSSVVNDLQPTVVYHLAARTDLRGARLSNYASTIRGTQNLLRALALADTRGRLLVTSSRLVCRTGYIPTSETDYCPDTIYGQSKVAQEVIVRQETPRDWTWVLLRPTSIWGPYFSVPYYGFFRAISRGLYVHPRGRSIWKSMGYIGNTIHQLLTLGAISEERIHGRTLTLCDYEPLEVGRWARLVAQGFGTKVHEAPLAVLNGLARAGDGLSALGFKNPPLTSFRLRNLLTDMTYPTEALSDLCGPLPYSVEEGTKRTVDWMRSNV